MCSRGRHIVSQGPGLTAEVAAAECEQQAEHGTLHARLEHTTDQQFGVTDSLLQQPPHNQRARSDHGLLSA